MTIATTLRKIQSDLTAALSESEPDTGAIELAARRIGAQAEMLEKGID
jgi:hypothetical protein